MNTGMESSKTEPLELRISKEQKELLQREADLHGLSLTDFIINTLEAAAIKVIQEREMMILSAQDRKVFVEALLNPPSPSAKLRMAAIRYKNSMDLK